jgi:carbamate kinase
MAFTEGTTDLRNRTQASAKTQELVVAALGGNAILKPGQRGTPEEQRANVETTCQALAKMVCSERYKLLITHGNGPQVGNILLQNELAKEAVAPMPLDICGAESQGLIGYLIAQTLSNALAEAGAAQIPVAVVVTQVLVDRRDPAFEKPSKPVGPFYTEAEAKWLAREKGYRMKEDAGRGWRRVVPSPDPVEICERTSIQRLLNEGTIVIAAGGGGIPVIRQDDGCLQGIEAVIDKDLAAERLAEAAEADTMLILTDVGRVMLNYGRPDQKELAQMTRAEAERYLAEGQFPAGSMGPKILAAVRFLKAGGQRVVIASLEEAFTALQGQAGTLIVP